MDSNNSKTTVEYYLNRLIHRAIVEPKPLPKIYEEECLRHPDIRITVSYKDFQASLQKHCMTLQTRPQGQAVQVKQETNVINKEHNVTFSPLIEDQLRKRRKSDAQSPAHHKMPQTTLERYSPQASVVTNARYARPGGRTPVPQQPVGVNIKGEHIMYSPPPPAHTPSHSLSRPPSVQPPPVEEEPPPEFIEMSSNPPRMSSNSQYSPMNLYQVQVSSEEGATTAPGGEGRKSGQKDGENSSAVDGAVQSSSQMDKNTSLSADDISPLNVRCVKCINTLVTCAVMPCGHCCFCSNCGQTALSLKQVCPVCRKSISTVIGYQNLIYNVYR